MQYCCLVIMGECLDIVFNVVIIIVYNVELFICESFYDNVWFVEEDCFVIICEGEYLVFFVNFNGLFSYVWLGFNGFFFVGGNVEIFIVVMLVYFGIYSVIIIDVNGCIVIILIDVMILDDLEISLVIGDVNVCEG